MRGSISRLALASRRARRGSGEQVRAREGRAEGDGLRVFDRVEDGEHQFADVNFGGLGGLLDDLRLIELAWCVGVNEIAGTWPGADQPATLQQVVRLEHRGRTDAVGLAGIAHRRYLLARAEHPGTDQFGNIVGEFLVAFHHGSAGSGYTECM